MRLAIVRNPTRDRHPIELPHQAQHPTFLSSVFVPLVFDRDNSCGELTMARGKDKAKRANIDSAKRLPRSWELTLVKKKMGSGGEGSLTSTQRTSV
jgi:hypothetical protein